MTFISQTPADDNGNYTVTFMNDNNEIITQTLNIFNF